MGAGSHNNSATLDRRGRVLQLSFFCSVSSGLRRVLHENAQAGLPDPQVVPVLPAALQGYVQGED